jgi:DNA invertase Pin-like site-specific DNA recombinase
MATQPTPRVAIYARAATRAQLSDDPLARQERACRAYAAAHGYVVAEDHVYRVIASGIARTPEPGVEAAVAAIVHGQLARIITASPDRVSRDPAQVARIECAARQAGGRVEYVQGGGPWLV